MLKKADWSGLRNLIVAKSSVGTLPPIAEYTETGNPATFETNIARPLTKFEVPLLPVQSGSGTPSPGNVRPISGWSGVTVTANGQTILAAWEPVAGVVYGGTVDLVSGVLTVGWGFLDLGSLNYFTNSDGNGNLYRSIETKGTVPSADWMNGIAKIVCQIYSPHSGNDTYLGIYDYSIAADANGQIYIYDSTRHGLTAAEFKTSLSDVSIAYALITPQTVQLSPVEIKTIIGQNSIATATGGTNTIKYLKRG